MATKKQAVYKTVDALKHDDASRKNIPTAEYQSLVQEDEQAYLSVAYERRNKDLDPQLVWRGKDLKDWSDLIVQAPPLYIQEKVHPKALIDDLLRQSKEQDYQSGKIMADLFSDFNGIPKGVDKTEFYQHDQNWTNRMILGDSLQVMASLAEREGLRGKVQCFFFDPPYGIKFNSNFQWSTTDKIGTTTDSIEKISREPEQVKAFRDTWRDGIHSYLTYLRDRLTIARDLLKDSGSIFVQIGDENVHRVRALMDEVFGEDNFIAIIPFRKKTMPFGSKFIEQMSDFLIWYAKSKTDARSKYRKQFLSRSVEGEFHHCWYEDSNGIRTRMSKYQLYNHALLPPKSRVYRLKSLEPSGRMDSGMYNYEFRGRVYQHPKNGFGTPPEGLKRIEKSNRLEPEGNRLCYVLYADEGESSQMTAPWSDTVGADDKQYVVQTNSEVIKRCILMTTDPGDLVLDPTCGSGTTAYVSEQWGRRWITIDTSRVSLALTRARIMGARYPFYLLTDSKEGQMKLAELTRVLPSTKAVQGNINYGFVYERLFRITVGSIANNAEIDVIWDKWKPKLQQMLNLINYTFKRTWQDWEIPQEEDVDWSNEEKIVHADWCRTRIAIQKEIDKSITTKAEFDHIYDRPYEDNKKIRVAGPFTVESISPHRVLGVDENDELIDPLKQKVGIGDNHQSFTQMILENLKMAGVQQAHKDDKIDFTALMPWPGELVCAEGRYMEGEIEKRAAIFVGAEFGTAQRVDLVAAAREAGDAGFDVLIACAFNYEAHATEFNKLGRIPVLKARMNADLHMADDLKNTGKGNLFVIFGEPDIDILPTKDHKFQVKINGVDVFHPNTGEVRSDGADGIACWFIDTDYNEESFFVRHAYFLGANDPYSSLKTTLKAEINKEAWDSLHSDTSRPFPKPDSGRIAVKVINHLGDEVMKVFKIS